MSKYIHFCHTCPVQIWGMTSQQRIERILGGSAQSCTADELKKLSDSDTVLILRGDYLFDDRLIENLAGTPNILLNLQDRQPQTAVAAHVPAGLAQQALDLISGKTTDDVLPGVKNLTPSTFPLSFQKKLRKNEPPFVLPITAARKKDLERRLFDWSYKGVTDLVTKWAWPWLARRVVGLCVRLHIRPNQVTLAGLVLVIIAGISFVTGQYGIGLAAGWLMTFLDTVDGKLARVTLTSSKFGHYFDHVIDLVHPPLWYILWAIGLPDARIDGLGLPLNTFFWLILAGLCGRPSGRRILPVIARQVQHILLAAVRFVFQADYCQTKSEPDPADAQLSRGPSGSRPGGRDDPDGCQYPYPACPAGGRRLSSRQTGRTAQLMVVRGGYAQV